MTSTTPKRIMAVDPGMQYVGIAIFEGEELLWYGVKSSPECRTLSQTRTQLQQFLTKLFVKYQPEVLAVEEPFYAQSLLSQNLRSLTGAIQTWGRWRKLQVHSYAPPTVKAFFCRDRRTKESLAEAMIDRYPFLLRYFTLLPWRRRYWFHVFDAVALGLMCHKKLAR